MKHHAKAASAGSTEVGGSARGLFRRAFATRAASPGSKGRGAPSRRGLGASVGLLVLLTLLVGLFTASSASAYYIPKLVEVNEVEYDSAHVVALASSDEFINGWAFEVSTDGGATWTVGAGAYYLGAADERPIEAVLALKGGIHYAVRFNLGGVIDPKAPGPYPEFTTLPVTPPENVAVNAPTALLSSQAVLNGKVKRASNPNSAFNIECRYENISDAQLKENEAHSLPKFEGAAVYPCAQNPVSEPGVEKTVTAKIGCNHPNYTYFEGGCLEPATTYHVRLIAEDGAPGSVAGEGTFTTLPAVAKPVVPTANSATEVSYRSAKVSGSVERPAGADPALDVYCFFEYVTEEQFTTTGFENANRVGCDQTPFDEFGMQHPITTSGPTPVTARLGGLRSGVTYHLRLGAENGSGLTTKDIPGTITTLPGGDLTYSIEPAKAIAGYTTIKLFGSVKYGLGPEAEAEEIAYSFEFAEVGTENWSGCCASEQAVPRGPGTKSVNQEFTKEYGIQPNTEYKYRLVVPWAGGNYLEAITPPPYPTLKTKPLAEPSVAINPVTSFNASTAHFSGTVNTHTPGSLDELGKAAYKTEWEFQCTPACPGPWSSGTIQGEEGSKAISVEALELHANTYYEVKLVAHNAFYTVESPVQTFETPLIAPTVSSAAGAPDGLGGYFLEGSVNSNNTKVTRCRFEYGTTATYPNTYEAECLPGPSGPDEVQLINVDASEGEFQLGLRGQTTSKLAFDAQPSVVQSALRALSKIGTNGVEVSGTPGAYKVTFSGGALAGANVEPIKGDNDNLVGGGGGGVSVSTETEGGNLHAASVEAHLENLTVGSTYHFRIIATSAGGTSTTVDHIFIPTLASKSPPCSNEQVREENSSSTLPECRAYEMVTSPFKVGFAGEFNNFSDGEGTNILYTSNAPNIAGSGEGFIGNRYIARRTPTGWETIPNRNGPSGSLLSPPNSVTGIGYFETNSFSANILSNLAPLATAHEPNLSIYIREANGLYVLVGHNADFSAGEELRGHSDDLSHSIFEGREGPYVSWGEGLYEFIGTGNNEPFRVDVNNAGEEVTDCNYDGGGGTDSQKSQGNSMSRDGRVIIYTARGCEKTTVYTPKVEKNQIWARVGLQEGSQVSYDLSASKCTRTASDPGGACNAPADARFEGSTPSGSRVFFSTTQQLVNGDTDETRDLYDCDIPAGEVAPTGLANSCSGLTQVSNAATGAEVENLLHISADGKTAYFVAKGVLASNTDALGEPALPGGHNLYVWQQDEAHPAGQTTFIGTLDENDLVSQITLSGRYLLFTTRSSLVSTDNDTARDVYRYDDQSGELTRISTGLSGTGGNGEFDASITGAGPGQQAGGSASAGAISEDGTKIVFNTAEALSPLDGNKAPDSYLWSEGEPEEGHVRGHVHLISTGAAGGGSNKIVITPSGRDIYFETPAALSPADGNLLNDVYDARIGGGFSFAQSSCSGEACRPSPTPVPAAEKAPSSAQPGPGNPPAPKTCSKGKVLKHGRCVVKKPAKKKHGHKKSQKHKRANSNAGGSK